MNADEAMDAVAQGATVVARYASGLGEHGRGRIISYSLVPTVTIECEDGSRFSWRHDMVDVVDADGEFCHVRRPECNWSECPQKRDGEPAASMRVCPLPHADLDSSTWTARRFR